MLAYGQTGSGKTHTMGSGGDDQDADTPVTEMGIIPRTVREIFLRVGSEGTDLEGATLSAKVSFIEVYKEDILDLLQRPDSSSCSDSAPPAKLATLDIRESKDGGVSLPGMQTRPVCAPEQVMAVLAEGSRNRATGATAMNATSSRSHAIFTVSLELRLKSGKLLTPRFNFVDLAGSERAKRTGASGDRFAEGVQINKGLLALGNVITALCEKQRHVPYRDSKLTRLLQDSLGGNAHTLMIACVSPADSDMEETLNTLKYANRARQIQNKLLIAQDPVQARIAELTEQVATLTARLQHYESGGELLPPVASQGLSTSQDAPRDGKTAVPAWSGGSAGPAAGASTTDMALQRCQQLQRRLQQVRAAQAAKHTVEPAEDHSAAVDPGSGLSGATATRSVGTVSGGDGLVDGDTEGEFRRPEEVALKQELLEEEIEFLTKQGELSEAMATLDESLALKVALLKQQEDTADGDTSVAGEVEEMQRVLADLEASVKETGRERDELARQIAELQEKSDAKAQALRESFARKLEAAEAQLRSLRNQQTTQTALLNARVAAERRVRQLAEEIGSIKAQKVALSRRMREEADAHRAQHLARERELKAMRRKEERTAAQLDKLQQDHAKQAAVLKRKHEEIAALQRRGIGPLGLSGRSGPSRPMSARSGQLTRPDASLPNVMSKVTAAQQARLADSRHAQHECATILGARPKEWFVGEVESAVALHQAREEKEVLIEKRRQAASLLAAKEEAATTNGDSVAAREVEELRSRISAHSREISVLNQKLSQREDGAHTKIETISSVSMSKALLRCAFDQTVAAQIALQVHPNRLWATHPAHRHSVWVTLQTASFCSGFLRPAHFLGAFVCQVKVAQLNAKDRALRDANDLTNNIRLQMYAERAKAQAREQRDADELAALQRALTALRVENTPLPRKPEPETKAEPTDESSEIARLERRLRQKAQPLAESHDKDTDGEVTTEDETDTEFESEEEVIGSDVDWSDTEEAKEALRRGGRGRQAATAARAAAATSGMFANLGDEASVATRRGRRTSTAPWANADAGAKLDGHSKAGTSPRDPPAVSASAREREVEPLLDRLSRKGTKPPPPPPPPPIASPTKAGPSSSRQAASAADKGMHERHGVDELRANLANVRRKLGQIDSNKAPELNRSSTSKESLHADSPEALAAVQPAATAPPPRRKLNNPKMLKQGSGMQSSAWTVQVDL